MRVRVPPIKSQGIKTKLVPWIKSIVPVNFEGLWIEPFMGTGVVAFNIAPQHALLCDTNPHLINFYEAISEGEITAVVVRKFLNKEGAELLEKGESHYYEIRERFNKEYKPLDFLFLNIPFQIFFTYLTTPLTTCISSNTYWFWSFIILGFSKEL